MPQTRWYNPHLPQTLAIAQILLYINAVFAFLYDVVAARDGMPGIVRLLHVASVAAYVFGGWGIANERKLGWQVGLAAAFTPFVLRFIDIQISVGSFVSGGEKIRYALGLSGGGLLNTVFDIALIALLLHPMSKDHQKIWFS